MDIMVGLFSVTFLSIVAVTDLLNLLVCMCYTAVDIFQTKKRLMHDIVSIHTEQKWAAREKELQLKQD